MTRIAHPAPELHPLPAQKPHSTTRPASATTAIVLLLTLATLAFILATGCVRVGDGGRDRADVPDAAPNSEPTPAVIIIDSADQWVPDVIENVMPAVVRVTVRSDDGFGTGTGIVFDHAGTIITNWHIVQGATEISVTLPTGLPIDAVLLREDPYLDLAVLTIAAEDFDTDALVPPSFGDSTVLRVGEDVVSVGHAFGLAGDPSVSRGVISALDRSVTDANGMLVEGLIQTDAAINLGSSGGALVNRAGDVVGINIGTIDLGQGANFALDINPVIDGANRLISLGPRPQPGYLGLGGVDVTPYMAFENSLPVREGFQVRYVDPQSPAAAVGFETDDIVVSIDDTAIRGIGDYSEFLRTHPEGTEIVVTAWRPARFNDQLMEIRVTLGAPAEDPGA